MPRAASTTGHSTSTTPRAASTTDHSASTTCSECSERFVDVASVMVLPRTVDETRRNEARSGERRGGGWPYGDFGANVEAQEWVIEASIALVSRAR
jgi:hypothetical protein